MKRIITALLLLAALVGASTAAPLSPEEALSRAAKSGPQRLKSKGMKGAKLVHTAATESGINTLYVFNRAADQGYLILSADDLAYPVLGYSDQGSFNINDIPPQMEWWLGEYSRHMEFAISKGTGEVMFRSSRSLGDAISPLVKTKWDQNSPYNRLCPTSNGTPCPTGCVATAMAQVMNYWQYPAKGSGIVRISLPSGLVGVNMLNLGNTSFDWDNMRLSYAGSYTEAEANAVAYLMQACGYASNMSYSPNGSGAISIYAAQALIKNFGYNMNIEYCSRNHYNSEMWEQIIYNELKSGRPIMYGGQSTSVGHEFVCDGYNGEGYFHFNWGWGGMSDGYFLLDALNPDAVGTGGGSGGGYNYGQDIIIGVQPQQSSVTMRLLQYGNLKLSDDSGRINVDLDNGGGTSGWYNQNLSSYNVELGATFTPDGGSEPAASSLLSKNGSKLSGDIAGLTLKGNGLSYAGWNAPAVCAVPESLPNGRYKVTICSRPAGGGDSDWLPVLTSSSSYYNYAYVTKSGSSITVTNMEPCKLSLVSAEFTSPLYSGCVANLKISVKNTSEKEITSGFYPYLFPITDNEEETVTPDFMGEGIVMTLKPGEALTQEFSTMMELVDGKKAPAISTDYFLLFLDPMTGTLYPLETKVTLKVNLTKPTVRVDKFEMPGLSVATENVSGSDKNVYIVRNKAAIPFAATVTCMRGYFGYPMAVAVFAEGQNSSNIIANLGPVLMLGAQQSGTASGTLSFGDGEANKYYHVALYYSSGGWQQMGAPYVYFRIDSSAVNEIEPEDGFFITYDNKSYELKVVCEEGLGELCVYDLSGRKVISCEGAGAEMKTVSLENLPAGIVMVVARSNSGKVKSNKLMR